MSVLFYETLDSTNDEAKRLIQLGTAEDGQCIIARTQTGGRGTQGRTWVSPVDAGLYFSIIHLPSQCVVPQDNLWTMAAGVACCLALTQIYPRLRVKIKPVNDLYIEGQKLGGILTESVIHQGKIQSIVTGVGINLFDVPRSIESSEIKPTSLSSWITSDELSLLLPKQLAALICQKLNPLYTQVQLGDADAVKRQYQQWLIES